MKTVIRRDIEGLRAVAVLLVLLFHLRVPGGAGGFAGVDVFFVISGFLITGLMLREVEQSGTVALGHFYARRARRLLPAALTVTLVTLLVGWWVLPGSDLPDLVADSIGATVYVVNWVLAARAVDYLAEDAGTSPLQHYWSLSVEEQFYLLLPVLILCGVRFAPRVLGRTSWRGSVLALLVLLTIASFVWSLRLTAADPSRAYFVTTTRLWELGAGALLAFAVPALGRAPRRLTEVVTAVGLASILASLLTLHTDTAWPGYAALLPVTGSVLVIAAGCAPHPTLGGRLLGAAPLVWIGGLSYAIYLWHWPLIVLAEAHWGSLPWLPRGALGLVAIALAWGTKHLVEDPVRYRAGGARSTRGTLVAGFVAMALVCGSAIAVLSTRPTLVHDPDAPGPAALVTNPADDVWELISEPDDVYTRSGPLTPNPVLARADTPGYYDAGCQIGQGDPEPRTDCVFGVPSSDVEVLLVGDSKAGQWFSAVDEIARQENWRLTTYLKSACALTVAGDKDRDCNQFGNAVLERVQAQDRPPQLVLMSSGAAGTPELEDGMVEAVEGLQAVGVRVVILADNDYPPGSRYECAAEHVDDLRVCSFDPTGGGGARLLARVATSTGSDVVNLNRWICPGGQDCPVAIGDQLLWRQGSHLTDTYIRSLTPFLYRTLAGLGATDRRVEEISLDDVPGPDS